MKKSFLITLFAGLVLVGCGGLPYNADDFENGGPDAPLYNEVTAGQMTADNQYANIDGFRSFSKEDMLATAIGAVSMGNKILSSSRNQIIHLIILVIMKACHYFVTITFGILKGFHKKIRIKVFPHTHHLFYFKLPYAI